MQLLDAINRTIRALAEEFLDFEFLEQLALAVCGATHGIPLKAESWPGLARTEKGRGDGFRYSASTFFGLTLKFYGNNYEWIVI